MLNRSCAHGLIEFPKFTECQLCRLIVLAPALEQTILLFRLTAGKTTGCAGKSGKSFALLKLVPRCY